MGQKLTYLDQKANLNVPKGKFYYSDYFDIKKSIGNKFCKSERFLNQKPTQSTSSQKENLVNNAKKMNNGFSFGTASQRIDLKESQYPSPGQYNLGSQFKILKEKKIANMFQNYYKEESSLPGPGHYDPKTNAFGKLQGKWKFGMRIEALK